MAQTPSQTPKPKPKTTTTTRRRRRRKGPMLPRLLGLFESLIADLEDSMLAGADLRPIDHLRNTRTLVLATRAKMLIDGLIETDALVADKRSGIDPETMRTALAKRLDALMQAEAAVQR